MGSVLEYQINNMEEAVAIAEDNLPTDLAEAREEDLSDAMKAWGDYQWMLGFVEGVEIARKEE